MKHKYLTIKIIILFAFGLFLGSNVQSQHKKGFCGSTEYANHLRAIHPEINQNQEQLELFTQDFIAKGKHNKSATYIIPVVVHIMHNYGIENVPDANVHDMMRIMNEDVQGNQPDTTGIALAFQNIKGGVDIEFRLATKDPNGNCTDGINRVYDPVYTYEGGYLNGTYNGFPPIQWPRDKYLNIWLVNEIDVNGQFLGYSSFPSFPSGRDGIVIQYDVFGSLPPTGGGNFAARYMSHEVGHYLNLCHIWSCFSGNGNPSNCNEDDNVTDTPNTVGTQNCNTNFSSCGSLDNVQNLMDYSYGSCSAGLMFTQGQAARMEAALNSPVGERNNLWTPANLLATGTDDATYANLPVCAPIADFNTGQKNACTNEVIQFFDESSNASYDSTWTYDWSFPGGTPSTSTDRNPTVSYAQAGDYDVSLTVSNSTGASQALTKNDYVSISLGSDAYIAPYYEPFSNTSWPQDPNDPSLDWNVIKPSGSLFQFQRTTNAFYSPPSSVFLNNFGYNGNGEHELYTPIADLRGLQAGSAYIKFRIAYSKKASENEVLLLETSSNCGRSWQIRKIWPSNQFLSVSTANPSSFVPADTSEWRFLSHDISAVAGDRNVTFRFRFQSKQGNNLFLDDIELSDNPNPTPITSISKDFNRNLNIYPNPNSGEFQIEFFSQNKENLSIEIMDLLGKKFILNPQNIQDGQNIISVNSSEYGIQSGVYIIRLSDGQQEIIRKVIIE